MAMNRVQFQKGLSMPEFLQRYGNEEQCEEALILARWPAGGGGCAQASVGASTLLGSALGVSTRAASPAGRGLRPLSCRCEFGS